MSTWPSPRVDRLGTPKTPAIRFTRAMTFVASWFTHLVRPTSLLASLNGSDRISPAIGGFYVRASGGSVTLPAAGYDYNSDWTPLLAGLSPARMTTSLAAPTPSSQWTFTTYSLPVSRRTHSRCGLHTRAVTNSWHANRRLQPLRYLHDCSDCFRLERLPGGLAPTGKRRLSTAHTQTGLRLNDVPAKPPRS
jgi:hypothetical protein